MVGPNGLEPSTSSVSGRRSNQLSYGPTCDGSFNSTGGRQFRQRADDVCAIAGWSRTGNFSAFSLAAWKQSSSECSRTFGFYRVKVSLTHTYNNFNVRPETAGNR
jgi:hypothetical protein